MDALDEIAPGLVHLAEELTVRVLGLQVGAAADVVRAWNAEHVKQARGEDVEAEGGESVRVDLVVGGDAVRVVNDQDPGTLASPLGVRHVTANPIVLLRQHAGYDRHRRSPLLDESALFYGHAAPPSFAASTWRRIQATGGVGVPSYPGERRWPVQSRTPRTSSPSCSSWRRPLPRTSSPTPTTSWPAAPR